MRGSFSPCPCHHTLAYTASRGTGLTRREQWRFGWRKEKLKFVLVRSAKRSKARDASQTQETPSLALRICPPNKMASSSPCSCIHLRKRLAGARERPPSSVTMCAAFEMQMARGKAVTSGNLKNCHLLPALTACAVSQLRQPWRLTLSKANTARLSLARRRRKARRLCPRRRQRRACKNSQKEVSRQGT